MMLVDDFSTYTVGQSLKLVNGWDNIRNSSFQPSLYDPENLLITTDDYGVNVLALSNRDASGTHGGDLQLATATGAALDIPDIVGQGTIYMRLKFDDAVSVSIATNGRNEGFCDDFIADGCQTVSGWADQSTISTFDIGIQTGPTYPFRGRNGGMYENSSVSTFDSDTWYEYWIQVDTVAQIANYYMRELGRVDSPTAMLNASGGQDWAFRNTSYSSITTLKFNIMGSPSWQCDNWPGGVDDPAREDCFYQETLISSIGIDASAWTLDRPCCDPPPPPHCAVQGAMGDFNCDEIVGMLDLDILGQNWGAAGLNPYDSYERGDATGDGEVGLLDLDRLSRYWDPWPWLPGVTVVPEPGMLSLMAIGGLLWLRRR